MAYFDGDGRFRHLCDAPGCKAEGSFGFGCLFRVYFARIESGHPNPEAALGRWYCREHRGLGDKRP